MAACVETAEREKRVPSEVAAETAYRYADSMLAARNGPQVKA